MKITVIPADGMVGIDGVFRKVAGLDLLYPQVHAVQWDGTAGHVEHTTGAVNLILDNAATLQPALDAWNALTPPAPTAAELLAAAKAAKVVEIEAARDAALWSPVAAIGHTWQADQRSQELLGQAITLAAAGLPLPTVWRDVDNVDLPISSLSDLITIAGVMALQTQAAYARSWERKALLGAAVTLQEVGAV